MTLAEPTLPGTTARFASGVLGRGLTQLHRELLVATRRPADALAPVLFFVIVASLYPFGLGVEPALLHAIGPGALWIAALLSCFLSLARMFAVDHASGALDQLALDPAPLAWLLALRIGAHWLLGGLPLVLLAPLLAHPFGLDYAQTGVLALGLLIGTPVLYLLGAIQAALTLGVRGGGVLMALLVLPLYIPVLILGSGAVTALERGVAVSPYLMLLAALAVLSVAFAPPAAALALRISLD